jgi:hypothetical protein
MRNFFVPLLLAAFALPLPAGAGAPVSAQHAALQFFVGSWNCTTHFGSAVATTHQDIAAENDNWLRGTATTMASGATASEDFYIGYDARHAQWTLISIESDGGYGITASNSAALDRSVWTALYPASGGKGTLTITSSTQYSIDSAWTQNGEAMSSHEACSKV